MLLQTKARGFLATGALVIKRETPLALYKGLGAVLSGIVPKMAIRFASFEAYKGWLADKETGKASTGSVFIGVHTFYTSLFTGLPGINSWFGGWYNRSSGCGDANGGGQDSAAGAITLTRRSARSPAIP